MKRNRSVRAALMISAAVILSNPAVAQQAAPAAEPVVTVTPPPVAPTASTQAATAATSAGDSATPINPEAAAQAEAEDAERAAERRDARRVAPRREAATAAPVVRAAPSRAAAPQQAAPAAPAAPAATTPAPTAAAPTAAETATQAPAPATAEPAQEGGAPVWPLAVIAALIVAAGAFFFLRRRKAADEEPYWTAEAEEPAYVEPVAAPVSAAPAAPAAPAAVAAAPLVTPRHDPVADAPVAPVAAEEASVAHADSDDVAALTAVDAPGDRPWLEFAMRPVRAGTNVDEALVEIELTVGNAGAIAAEDVRISTFMLSADDTSEMERLLIEPRDAAAVSPLTIAAGEGTRVDATLAMNRAALAGEGFRPVIVADARYRLPDGSEGRTSASFLVGGATDSGAPEPIALDRNLMRDDVEAQLFRQPERV